MPELIHVGDQLIHVNAITMVDCARIEALEVTIHHHEGVTVARGPDAIDALLHLRPSILEGRRLRFARHAWAIHNLLGHPGMQVLTWLGLRALGLALHDATVPRPTGPRLVPHRAREAAAG